MREVGEVRVYPYDELPEDVRFVVLEGYRDSCARELHNALHERVVPTIAEAAGKLGLKVAVNWDGKDRPSIFWETTSTGARRVRLCGTWAASGSEISTGAKDEGLRQVAEQLAKAKVEHPDAKWRNTVFAAGKYRLECNCTAVQRAMDKFMGWAHSQFQAEWDRMMSRESLDKYLAENLRTAGVEFTGDGKLYQQDLLTEVCAEIAQAIRHARGDLMGAHDGAVTAVARRIGRVFVQRGVVLDERFLEATGHGLRERIDAAHRRAVGLPAKRTREEVDAGLCDPSAAVREAVVREEELTQVQLNAALIDEDANVRRAVVDRHGKGMTKNQVALALIDEDLQVRLAAASVNWESYRMEDDVARAMRAEALAEAMEARTALKESCQRAEAGEAHEAAEEHDQEPGLSR